jgi:hypothetical protein
MRYAKIATENDVKVFVVADSGGDVIVTVYDNSTDLTPLVGERVYLSDFEGNSFTDVTDSGGEAYFSELTPGTAYVATWVKEDV